MSGIALRCCWPTKALLIGSPVIGLKIWIGAAAAENSVQPATRAAAADVGHDRITTLDRFFERQGRRPAGAEGGRVGQEVRRGPVRAAADAEPAEVVSIEVEERRRATGGDTGELDERLVKDYLVLRLAEEVDADRRLGVALTDRGAGVELAGAA